MTTPELITRLRDTANALEILAKQLEALQVDAERYRWLRDEALWTLVSSNGKLRLAARLDVDYTPTVDETGADMNAAIDAARTVDDAASNLTTGELK